MLLRGLLWTVAAVALSVSIVPAHAFALTGSYMGAVTQIAAAAGGYIQPSPVDQTLRALSRYPTAPWNWDTTHIDYELPSDVVTVEGSLARDGTKRANARTVTTADGRRLGAASSGPPSAGQ